MGPPLDYHRHLPRRARPGPGPRPRPRPHHGRPLSLLPPRRLARRSAQRGEITRSAPSSQPTRGDIRHGFVYERAPHITLKSIADNAEIDVIWDRWQETLEPLRETLNAAMGKAREEWEIPHVAEDLWPAEPLRLFNLLQGEQAKGANARQTKIEEALSGISKALERDYSIATLPARPVDAWPEPAAGLHAEWWKARIARQQDIDASIAAKADSEFCYDKPYT